MGATDRAVRAAERAVQEEQARAKQERERDVAERNAHWQAAYAKMRRLMDDSPLERWFPGQEWQLQDEAPQLGTPRVEARGEAVVVQPVDDSSFQLILARRERDGAPACGEVLVFVGQSATDTETGYGYWNGARVKSLADVGKVLLARREREARRGR